MAVQILCGFIRRPLVTVQAGTVLPFEAPL